MFKGITSGRTYNKDAMIRYSETRKGDFAIFINTKNVVLRVKSRVSG